MAIKRLTPTVRDMGYLRLWRDDIAEIAEYVAQLSDAKVVMEADHNELDDVQVDLPKIGKRLGYFTLTAIRPDEGGQPHEVLKVYLTRRRCSLKADNPDPEVRGIIADIEDAARRYRRVPKSLPRIENSPSPYVMPWAALLYAFGGACVFMTALFSAISLAGLRPSPSR